MEGYDHTFKVVVNGNDYLVAVEPYMVIRDSNGHVIADAEHDHLCECVNFSYYVDGGRDDSSQSCLYYKTDRQLAEWLIVSHPSC